MVHIIHKIPRCSDEMVEEYRKQASATVHEAMGRRGAMDPAIKPLAKGMKVAGRAITVKCHPADNVMIVKAISMAKENDVIVVDMGGLEDIGPFGGVLATECKTKKLGGLVFNCCVRDSAEIIAMGLPVFSTGLCIRGTMKTVLGTINHPMSCGDQIINPGDMILGDDDGVVVIPYGELDSVLEAAKAREAKETVYMERLRSGESAFDIYGYQKLFDKLGCVEESEA